MKKRKLKLHHELTYNTQLDVKTKHEYEMEVEKIEKEISSLLQPPTHADKETIVEETKIAPNVNVLKQTKPIRIQSVMREDYFPKQLSPILQEDANHSIRLPSFNELLFSVERKQMEEQMKRI